LFPAADARVTFFDIRLPEDVVDMPHVIPAKD
jgi:hypothetical protein